MLLGPRNRKTVLMAWFLFLVGAVSALVPSLSDSSVLLPRKTASTQVHYHLFAFNGCFRWSSLNTDVATVSPVDDSGGQNGCSSQAVVTAESTSSERHSTWIEARDVLSSAVLRCEVFVDKIKNFTILTTTRKLYRSDFELLKIQALDDEGNLFSTVEGLPFEWSVTANKPSSGALLRIVPFRESSVEVSQIVLAMEDQGTRTSVILLQGIQPGKADIQAKLADMDQEAQSTTARVQISVVEPIIIFPTEDGETPSPLPSYVVPGSRVQYMLSILSSIPSVPAEIIRMPNNKYSWSVDNEKVAMVNSNGLVTARSVGTVHVTVRHMDVPDSETHATLHVVLPSELRLSVSLQGAPKQSSGAQLNELPGVKWVIIGRTYVFSLILYDASGHTLSHMEGLQFTFRIDKTHLRIIEYSKNDARHLVVPVSEGRSRVTASLVSDEGKWSIPPLEVTIQGSTEIRVAIETIILPWDSRISAPVHPVQVTGGSGEYSWHSVNASVVSISSDGWLTAHGIGTSSISVHDIKNPLNTADIQVAVAPVSKIQLRASSADCQVGYAITVTVTAWTADGQSFMNCSFLPLEWHVTPHSVFSVQQNEHSIPEPGGCASVALLAVGEGEGLISLRYGRLYEELQLFSYAPLTLRSPSPLIVAVGAPAPIVFEGGPYPHTERDRSSFVLAVVPSDPHIIQIAKDEQQPPKYRYTATCLTRGEAEVTIVIGDSNVSPSSTEVVKISCVLPSRLTLSASEPSSWLHGRDAQACRELSTPPIELMDLSSATSYLTGSNRDIPFNVSLKDSSGRDIQYFGSLMLEWSSEKKTAVFSVPSSTDGQAVLHIGDVQGPVSVTVSVSGYLPSLGINDLPILPVKDLRKSFVLNIAPPLRLNPAKVLVYNHPRNVARLTKESGSLVSYTTNDTETIDLSPSPDLSAVDIVPRKAGIAAIRVRDRCILDAPEGQAIAHIGDIAWIRLEQTKETPSSGQAIIQHGDTLTLTLSVGAGPGYGENPYPSEQYQHIPLQVHVDNPDSVSVRTSTSHPDRYIVHALSTGIARIIISAKTASGRVVSSASMAINVYPPATLRPERLVLVPGGKFTVEVFGGPPLQPQHSFSVENQAICSVNAEGQVTGLSPGSTNLVVVVTSSTTSTASTAIMPVTVNPLDGIQIHANTDRLIVGSEMSLRVVGPDGETPFTLGTLNIRFAWHSRDPTVASLIPIYAAAGTRLEDEMGFSVRVKGLNPGSTVVSVSASHSPEWIASQTITVVDGLTLLTPAEVLLPPHGLHTILTNKNDCGCLSFRLLDASEAISLSPDGTVTAGLVPGNAVIQVADNTGLSLIVQIHVRAIYQLQLLPVPSFFHEIPIGGEMGIQVVVRDEVGQIFTTLNSLALDYQLDQKDVISIRKERHDDRPTEPVKRMREGHPGEGLFVLTGLREGHAILRIFTLGQPILDDYLEVSVGQVILPRTPFVHVGGSISFGIALSSHPEVVIRNLWSSDNEGVLKINATSGEAVALTPGHARIFYNGTIHTYVEAQVRTISKVTVDVSVGYITNVGEGRKYPFQLHYTDSAGHNMTSVQARINNKIVVACSLPASTLWVTADFARDDSGNDYCVLSPSIPSSPVLPPRMPDSVTLIVTVRDVYATYELQHKETIPFAPAFLVKGNLNVVQLSASRPWTHIEVWSSSPIFATTTDAALVSVRLHNSDSVTGKHVYEIRALSGTAFSDVGVELFNPLTQQSQLLLVNFGFDAQLITTEKRQQSLGIVSVTNQKASTLWLQPLGWIVGTAILACLVTMVIMRLFRQPHQPSPSPAPTPSSIHRVGFAHSVSSPMQPPSSRRSTAQRSPVYFSPHLEAK